MMIKIWVISVDGIPPTKPIGALGRPIQAVLGGPSACQLVEIVLAKPKDARKLENNMDLLWDHLFSENEVLNLETIHGKITKDWPDIVLTAHQSMAAIGPSIAQASGGLTKTVQLQLPNASGLPHYDLAQYDVIIPQPHERVEDFAGANNIIRTNVAVHLFDREMQAATLEQAPEIIGPVKHPMLLVNLGGNDPAITITEDNMRQLGRDIRTEAGRFVEVNVVPMHRTSPAQLAALNEVIQDLPNVRVVDKQHHKYYLVSADKIISSCEGSLLNWESAATGKPAAIYPYTMAQYNKLPLVTQGTWPYAIDEGKWLGLYPSFSKPHAGTQEEMTVLARKIVNQLGYRPAP